MNIIKKQYYDPFHRYFDKNYNKDIVITDNQEIINFVIKFFKDGKFEYIEPAHTIYRSLIYAALKQKHFGGNFNQYLDDSELVYDNMYFKKYSENKEIYDEIIKNITDVFFYNISLVEDQFNKEYFNKTLIDYGCFIHDNILDIINQKLTHYRFFITKNYLINLREEAIKGEFDVLYKEEILSKYIEKGNIKITYEDNNVGIMYSKISENDKFMIYYYLKDKGINKIISENKILKTVFEYNSLKEFMEAL